MLYSWVKNIVYYFIFITVIGHILPHKKYEKFIKLFSGLILILIVIQPVIKGLKLEEQINYYFESYSFKNEVGDFEKELLGIENQRVDQMIGRYEQAVAMDIDKITLECGFYPVKTKVKIEGNKETEQFGTVTGIQMVVSLMPQESAEIMMIDPVMIRIEGDSEEARQQEYQEEQTTLNVLRRKIESYYGLEASYVEIRLEQE